MQKPTPEIQILLNKYKEIADFHLVLRNVKSVAFVNVQYLLKKEEIQLIEPLIRYLDENENFIWFLSLPKNDTLDLYF